MYKCLVCGHIFEEGEQAEWKETHGFNDGFVEEFDGCPICHGNFEKTKSCKLCQGDFLEDELFDGICKHCLKDEIDYDVAFDYMVDNESLSIFVFEKVYKSTAPEKISFELQKEIEHMYKRLVADEKLQNIKELYKKIVEFIMEDDKDFGKENFAEWLNEKGVKK